MRKRVDNRILSVISAPTLPGVHRHEYDQQAPLRGSDAVEGTRPSCDLLVVGTAFNLSLPEHRRRHHYGIVLTRTFYQIDIEPSFPSTYGLRTTMASDLLTKRDEPERVTSP